MITLRPSKARTRCQHGEARTLVDGFSYIPCNEPTAALVLWTRGGRFAFARPACIEHARMAEGEAFTLAAHIDKIDHYPACVIIGTWRWDKGAP